MPPSRRFNPQSAPWLAEDLLPETTVGEDAGVWRGKSEPMTFLKSKPTSILELDQGRDLFRSARTRMASTKSSKPLRATGVPKRQLYKIVPIVPSVSSQQSVGKHLRMSRDKKVWNHAASLASSLEKRPIDFPCQYGHMLGLRRKTEIPIGQETARFPLRQDRNQLGKSYRRNNQLPLNYR